MNVTKRHDLTLNPTQDRSRDTIISLTSLFLYSVVSMDSVGNIVQNVYPSPYHRSNRMVLYPRHKRLVTVPQEIPEREKNTKSSEQCIFNEIQVIIFNQNERLGTVERRKT